MGGNASMSIGLRHRDRFDFIGDLGGEPGPAMTYSLAMFRDFLFGGFCTAAPDDGGDVGALCLDDQRPAAADQFEIKSDFEHMTYQDGEGVGLTLRRNLYMKAARDLSRALGNPALYNPDPAAHGYAPPGVDAAYLARAAADRCANPLTLTSFHDREFNPDGSLPVITFCDGGDSATLGLGVFDPAQPQGNPAEVLLAVDVNRNGRRDSGDDPGFDSAKASALEAEVEAIDAKLEKLRHDLSEWSADILAFAGVVVALDRNGEVIVHRGMVKPEDRKQAAKAAAAPAGGTGK